MMSNEFWDHLFTGLVSRRSFLEKFSAASVALPVMATPAAEALAQQKGAAHPGAAPPKPKPNDLEIDQLPDDNPTYSPSNIGGGGRLERNFYRRWIKGTKVPTVEGYSILDARTQEVFPWPEIEGRGVYLNFSGNVHMDGVIYEIPPGKALAARHNFYKQNIIGFVVRSRYYEPD